MTTQDSITIEAEGYTYRQKYLSSEDGLALQLLVAKIGVMPALQAAAQLAGADDAETFLKRLSGDTELQAQLLGSLYQVLQTIDFDQLKQIKTLMSKVTWLQREVGEMPLSELPNHFSSIVDNNRLFVLLFHTLKFQLAPFFRAQFLRRILGRQEGTASATPGT